MEVKVGWGGWVGFRCSLFYICKLRIISWKMGIVYSIVLGASAPQYSFICRGLLLSTIYLSDG